MPQTFFYKLFSYSLATVLLFSNAACGQSQINAEKNNIQITDSSSFVPDEPPECECCVMREAPSQISNKLVIAPEKQNVERITLRGTIYESDGKTPARGVLMYFYQADETGRYTKRGDEDKSSFAWWHGKQRGWLRTNERGEYEFDTVKPAAYPTRTEPAHIHTLVKSPSQRHCYYIADYVFQGDELLTPKFWANTDRWWREIGVYQKSDYGGVRLEKTGDKRGAGRRDITLFPEYDLPVPNSGRDILAESPAFDPQHAWGADKGSHACPMCKYGYQPGVLYWVNDDKDWTEIENWARFLEKYSAESGIKNFKAYLIYTNPNKLTAVQMDEKLASFGRRLNLERIALTYVPSADDRQSNIYLNQINPQTRNTFIVYNNRRVADKFVNFAFSEQNQKLLKAAVALADKEKALYRSEE